jgi:hypothetical protein
MLRHQILNEDPLQETFLVLHVLNMKKIRKKQKSNLRG